VSPDRLLPTARRLSLLAEAADALRTLADLEDDAQLRTTAGALAEAVRMSVDAHDRDRPGFAARFAGERSGLRRWAAGGRSP
jgi:hypothetical protein